MSRKKKARYRIIGGIGILLCLVLGVLFVFPYFEQVSDAPTETSADWMKEIEDEAFLQNLNIPGTHDSAAAYVQLPYFMRCQSLSIEEQLEAGYRYLDIRLNVENGKMFLYHAFARCKTGMAPWADHLELEQVLAQVYSFLQSHPSETVLFVVKQEGSGDVATFQNVLQEYIAENPEKWLLTDNVPTLGEARGKVVLFRRYTDKAGLKEQAGIALGWNDQGGAERQTDYFTAETVENVTLYIQDRYNYTVENKKVGMEEALRRADELALSGAIRINFASTAGPKSLHHPYKIAKQMNAWFKEKDFNGNPGWVIFDHGDAALAETVYRLNK